MSDDYTIHVTQQDIDLGVRDQSGYCIVATAIGRQIKEALRISVAAQDIRFTIGKRRLIYATPPAVGAYIIAFDAGDFAKIKPMTFRLFNPFVAEPSQRRASRLIVRGERPRGSKVPSSPSRTRIYGQRVFRANQPQEA